MDRRMPSLLRILLLPLALGTLTAVPALAGPDRDRGDRDRRPGEELQERVGIQRVPRLTLPRARRGPNGGVFVPAELRRVMTQPEAPEVHNLPNVGGGVIGAAPSGVQTVGANVRANNTAGDLSNTTNSETHLAALGNNVVAAWNDGLNFGVSPGNTGYAYSTDGGLTFTDGGVPPVTGVSARHEGDPVVACDGSGNFFLADLYTTSGSNSAIAVTRGTFSGSTFTWNTPSVPASTSSDFLDKEWMAVDRANGNVYLVWTRFLSLGGTRIEFTRSTDHGATWSPVIQLTSSAAEDVQGARVAVGPNHEVQVIYYAYDFVSGFNFMRTRRSTNLGVSFAAEVTLPTGASGIISNYGSGPPGFNRNQGIGFPSLTIDGSGGANNGRVYATWEETFNFYYDNLGTTGTVNESESNNTSGTATAFTPGKQVNGTLASGTDQDWFSFSGTAGQQVILYLNPVAAGTDGYLQLFMAPQSGATRTAFSYLGAGQALVVYTLPKTATYYVLVYPATGAGTGTYVLYTGLHTALPADEVGRDTRDVVFQSSADGTTWDTRRVINDDAVGFDNTFPEVAVDAAGTVLVDWYDHRNDVNGILTDIYYNTSTDAGVTFGPAAKVNDGASINWNTVASNLQPNMGDYSALVAEGSVIYANFADGRQGSPDAWVARITTAVPYTITASAGAGGTINPNGAVPVTAGANQTFTIAPDGCHTIADVLVDGVSVGAVPSYTFTNVTANHTIAVSFTATGATWTIAASAGANGSISPAGSVPVACGANQAFAFTPDPGYMVADVVVDGGSLGPMANYTFNFVTANHTIAVSFSAANVYTWNVTGSGAWTTASNWTPARTLHSANDILVFSNGALTNVTGVPSDTMARLVVTGNTSVTLNATSVVTLNIGGAAGTDFDVQSGCTLNLNAVSPGAIQVALGPSATGAVAGSMTLTGGAHRLLSGATNALSFENGSVLTLSTGFAGNVFGTTSLNSVVLQGGALLVQGAGANPFGASAPNSVVTFLAGSRFRLDANLTPSMSGRSYADFEYNTSGTISNTGAQAAKIDNVFVDQGTWNLNMTGAMDIKGGITVNPGATMTISPAGAATVALSGSAPQVVTINGTFTNNASSTIEVKNAAGVQLATNLSLTGPLKFTTGTLTTGANTLILAGTSAVTGAAQGTGWVNGRLRRTVAANVSPQSVAFDVGTAATWSPVALSVAAVSTPFDVTASAATPDHPNLATSGLDGNRSVNRWWSLALTGTPPGGVYDAVFTFAPTDVDGGANTAAFEARRWNGSAWSSPGVGARTATSTAATGIPGSGEFAIGEPAGPLTITASAGPGGSITPSGAVPVSYGGTQPFTITPGPGFAVADVQVDAVSVGAVTGYTFTNVTANHTIAATFSDTAGPVVQVTAPNGGESLNVGALTNLTWTAADNAGPIATVDLALSRDNGASWETIANGVANTGGYGWTVTAPGTNSGPTLNYTALFRVTASDAASHTGSDSSDAGFSIYDPAPTGVGDRVTAFELSAVTPNPARGAVRIAYALAHEGPVDLAVLDVQGRVVHALARGTQPPGRYQAGWSGNVGGTRATPGLYFVRLRAGGKTFTRRFAIVQ